MRRTNSNSNYCSFWSCTLIFTGSPLHERPTLTCGRRKSVLRRHWSIQQLDSFIVQSYPNIPLGLIGFDYGFASKSRAISKINRQDLHNVADVEASIGQGRFFIIPNEDIQVHTSLLSNFSSMNMLLFLYEEFFMNVMCIFWVFTGEDTVGLGFQL